MLPRAVVEAGPLERLPVAAEPSVPLLAEVEEAQREEPLEAVAVVQPSVARAEEEVQHAAEPAAAEVLRAEVRAVGAEQRVVEPAAVQVRPLEAEEVLLSAEPSVHSDRQARARLARRRMTTAFRHEPALAQTERLRSQSSSAG